MEFKELHEHLWIIVEQLPSDNKPYGKREQDEPDCSCGCKWYLKPLGDLGDDWGVCINPKSPRVAKLTYDQQGC